MGVTSDIRSCVKKGVAMGTELLLSSLLQTCIGIGYVRTALYSAAALSHTRATLAA